MKRFPMLVQVSNAELWRNCAQRFPEQFCCPGGACCLEPVSISGYFLSALVTMDISGAFQMNERAGPCPEEDTT